MRIRITVDPNTIDCPDYGSQDYTAARDPLVANGSTHDEATQLLTAIWNTTHAIECQRWQTQIDADKATADAQRLHHEAGRARAEEEAEKERQESEKEEKKKHKSKYAPIPNRGIPTQQPVIASPAALEKLLRGDYCPLWYWTKNGIDEANKSFISSDTEAYNFVRDENGNTTLTPAIPTRESNAVIPDSKLPFDDFLVAIPRMIEAMGQAQWPPERLVMMSRFWDNILNHPTRSSGIPEEKHALMVYQEEQRKQWHHACSVPGRGYDLSEINQELLTKTQERLLWERRRTEDEQHRRIVSNLNIETHIHR